MKKYMKVLAVLLTASMLLCACGSAAVKEETTNETVSQESEEVSEVQDLQAESDQTENDDALLEESISEDTEDAAEDTIEEAAAEFVEDRSEVFALFEKMHTGWNLGNTFDALGAGDSNSAEMAWGNPKTTKEMIDEVVGKGFDIIRIPVTWAEHVGPAPEYTINQAWLDRVQEVVDYAYNQGAYVILDTHHEENFWMSTDTDPTKAAAVEAELVAIWTQVANQFKDYDEKLLFEGMNEPRLVGSENEWNGGTPEERALINEWNQAFIDAVRATGGNNETRVLIICPYGNCANLKAIKELAIPEDNYIAVAIHMYTPYFFTYAQSDPNNDIKGWDGSMKADIVNTLKPAKTTLLNKDVPVIITEYGAMNKGNEEDVKNWLADYLGIMNNNGVKAIWWDNGIYNTAGEKFAIFDRKNCAWFAPGIVDKIMELTY